MLESEVEIAVNRILHVPSGDSVSCRYLLAFYITCLLKLAPAEVRLQHAGVYGADCNENPRVTEMRHALSKRLHFYGLRKSQRGSLPQTIVTRPQKECAIHVFSRSSISRPQCQSLSIHLSRNSPLLTKLL